MDQAEPSSAGPLPVCRTAGGVQETTLTRSDLARAWAAQNRTQTQHPSERPRAVTLKGDRAEPSSDGPLLARYVARRVQEPLLTGLDSASALLRQVLCCDSDIWLREAGESANLAKGY